MKTLILAILIILSYNLCYSQTEITPSKAKFFVGEQVLVTGKIKEIKEGNSGDLFLNFEKKYPNTPLTIVIYANDRAIIQSSFMIKWINLVNATLTISGVIETYNDKPEIVLKKADQIVSID